MSQVTKTFTEHPQNSITLMNVLYLSAFQKNHIKATLYPIK